MMSMMQHTPHMPDITRLGCMLNKPRRPICCVGGKSKALFFAPYNAGAGQIIEMSKKLAIPIWLEMGISTPTPPI
jgi:hypothetical protein